MEFIMEIVDELHVCLICLGRLVPAVRERLLLKGIV